METSKLRPKYDVQRVGPNGELVSGRMRSTDPENPDSPFVLMPRKDPAAFFAMLEYTRHCEPHLADEIRNWLESMADTGPEYGTQGTRNWIHVRKRSIYLTV